MNVLPQKIAPKEPKTLADLITAGDDLWTNLRTDARIIEDVIAQHLYKSSIIDTNELERALKAVCYMLECRADALACLVGEFDDLLRQQTGRSPLYDRASNNLNPAPSTNQ